MATFLELLHEAGTTTQITTAEFVRPTVRMAGVSLEDMKLEESEEPQVEPEEQSVSDLIQAVTAAGPAARPDLAKVEGQTALTTLETAREMDTETDSATTAAVTTAATAVETASAPTAAVTADATAAESRPPGLRTFAIQPTNILGESYFCHHQWQALFWF
jgi:hypothetical protein